MEAEVPAATPYGSPPCVARTKDLGAAQATPQVTLTIPAAALAAAQASGEDNLYCTCRQVRENIENVTLSLSRCLMVRWLVVITTRYGNIAVIMTHCPLVPH